MTIPSINSNPKLNLFFKISKFKNRDKKLQNTLQNLVTISITCDDTGSYKYRFQVWWYGDFKFYLVYPSTRAWSGSRYRMTSIKVFLNFVFMNDLYKYNHGCLLFDWISLLSSLQWIYQSVSVTFLNIKTNWNNLNFYWVTVLYLVIINHQMCNITIR